MCNEERQASIHPAGQPEVKGRFGAVWFSGVLVGAALPGQVAESAGDAVAKGKAEIALHQLQELMAVPDIEIVGPFPRELQGSFAFSAAICTNAKETEAAKALIEFLRTPDAVRVIRAKGMEPIAP